MVVANNPVLCGFYPDPSICRVGEDFYMVNSSFAYFPGVPIFHSKDLAHWEQIGNVLDRKEQLPLEGSEISRGIFAPTIRYHEGTYYMITTNVSFGGNFIVTATNPAGPWSNPYYLGDDAKGIDPSLFFDEDGRCYYVGTRPNPEGVRYNGDWEIWVQELDLEQMKLVGESMAIWKGAVKGVIWPEGPHIYKKDGYYYLLHAEGGTGPEHSISVARSKNLFQWFEGCPRNPIFTHRNLGMDYPIIYAGHGDLVDDEDDNWYVIMLASRPCEKHSSMGRESFLAKVVWENGWPVINPGIGKLEDAVTLPFAEQHFLNEMSHNDTFTFYENKLDDRLMGIIEREKTQYSLDARYGFLRMPTMTNSICETVPTAYLGIRQKDYCFEVRTALEFTPHNTECAGLVYYQNHENHLRMVVRSTIQGRTFAIIAHVHGKDTQIATTTIPEEGMVQVIFRAKNQKASVWACVGEKQILVAEEISLLAYTTEEAGGFVGCTIGMYASAEGEKSENYADFAYLTYQQVL